VDGLLEHPVYDRTKDQTTPTPTPNKDRQVIPRCFYSITWGPYIQIRRDPRLDIHV